MGKTKANSRRSWGRRCLGLLGRIAEHVHDDRGDAAVPFLLCLPIFLTVVAVIVQFAILVNAKIMVEHAAHMAGRAAITSLPDGHPDNVLRAAQLVLAPLSPQMYTSISGDRSTTFTSDTEAVAMGDLLATTTGTPVSPSFAKRYSYARYSDGQITMTTVEYPDIDYTTSSTREITVGVRYQLLLTVPVAKTVLAPTMTVLQGVGLLSAGPDLQHQSDPPHANCRFWSVHATCTVQTSPARASRTGWNGWPG